MAAHPVPARVQLADSPPALRLALRLPAMMRRAFARAFAHDAPNIAQSAAYSGMVALFPALIVAAAIIALLPDTAAVRSELSGFFSRILPADVLPVLAGYFQSRAGQPHTSLHALLLGILVSILGASGVIATFMEGLRRAADLPSDCWSFLRRRARSLLLVPLSVLPFAAASLLVVFGHLLGLWVVRHVPDVLRAPVFLLAMLLRWSLSLMGSIGVIALLYQLGTPTQTRWRRTLPGAVVATVLWFLATIAFGWYVTRYANYSRVYGSLGAGIALLFWLYLISLSVLCGAEFNTVFSTECDRPARQPAASAAGSPNPVPSA